MNSDKFPPSEDSEVPAEREISAGEAYFRACIGVRITPADLPASFFNAENGEPRPPRDEAPRYPCPCCGYIVHSEPPGSYHICPICFWEDDIVQLRFVLCPIGANRVCLAEAQKNFAQFGAETIDNKEHVRAPTPEDARDPLWRRLTRGLDKPEVFERGKLYGGSYPDDTTELYYWRPTYWRKQRA